MLLTSCHLIAVDKRCPSRFYDGIKYYHKLGKNISQQRSYLATANCVRMKVRITSARGAEAAVWGQLEVFAVFFATFGDILDFFGVNN